MSYIGDIISHLKANTKEKLSYDSLTLGQVIDVNDPQQMGRLRVMAPTLGDNRTTKIKDIPWALYISPFGGTNIRGSRGRGDDITTGQVAYGFWNIPKIRSYVLVGCIDGDPNHRFWIGSAVDQYFAHTMPHGRYSYARGNGEPEGPISSTEFPIEPLSSNMREAFGNYVNNFEFRTRAADHQVAALDGQNVDNALSRSPDDKDFSFPESDGNTITSRQGYKTSRQYPDVKFSSTNGNYESQVYSWTTPGFHAISLDDSPENCRVRIRTTGGHQIILDDSNERIYISTLKGNNWIELDESGNIDIFSARRISVNAEKDINFTTEGAFRVNAKEGIHMYTDAEYRVHCKQDFNVFSEANIRVHSNGATLIQAEQDGSFISTGAGLFFESGEDTNILAGVCLKLSSADSMNLFSTAEILSTGSEIHFNGPEAAMAAEGIPAEEKQAWWTNRVPEHEPWGRIMMVDTDNDEGNTHTLQLDYNSNEVGRTELDDTITRNPNWHR